MAQPNIPEVLSTWKNNFTRNTADAFAHMGAKDYIRLVVIVGTYLLIRPHLLKLGAKLQERQHGKDAAAASDSGAEIHPNELRGGKVEIPGVGDSEDEDEGNAKPGDWGKKARIRQRKFIRETLAKEEARLLDEQEAESDKEIEQYLVD